MDFKELDSILSIGPRPHPATASAFLHPEIESPLTTSLPLPNHAIPSAGTNQALILTLFGTMFAATSLQVPQSITDGWFISNLTIGARACYCFLMSSSPFSHPSLIQWSAKGPCCFDQPFLPTCHHSLVS